MRKLGGSNLKNVDKVEASRKSLEAKRIKKLIAGPSKKELLERAKQDARGQVLRNGVTYSAAHPTGQPWTILRSKSGRTNQVDLHVGDTLSFTGSLRSLERGMKRAKL